MVSKIYTKYIKKIPEAKVGGIIPVTPRHSHASPTALLVRPESPTRRLVENANECLFKVLAAVVLSPPLNKM